MKRMKNYIGAERGEGKTTNTQHSDLRVSGEKWQRLRDMETSFARC
jgi:hypothetical protein